MPLKSPTIIETIRLLIRPVEERDLPDLLAINGDAEVSPANDRSNRLIQKLGFRKEGLLRQRWFDEGSAHDTNIYGLLRDEWPGSA